MTQKTRIHEGYLMVDHRAGPGLPEDMARAAGYDPKQCVGGRMFEAKTMTCSHCNAVVVLKVSPILPRHYCGKCDHYICQGCGFLAEQPGYQHVPFQQVIDVTLDLASRGVDLSKTATPINLSPKVVVL
jgi:hypothetical protein